MTNQSIRKAGKVLCCPVCGAEFYKKRAELRAVNYCSRKCSATANYALAGVNRGRRRSPGTEFQKGIRPHNWTTVGDVRIRQRHNRHDAPRAWVKVAEPNVWRERARVVYESAYGAVPRGMVIHHINGDSLDDRLENLQALTRAQHAAVHATPPNKSI